MLVIISDLHLTDGSSGQTIKAGAFRVFRQRLRDLAYDASWRADSRYEPIEEIDIILLGDILDLIRSTQWSGDNTVKPWAEVRSPAFVEKIETISAAVLQQNQESLALLKNLSGDKLSEMITLPLATKAGRAAEVGWQPDAPERLPVKVRIHYLVGNHDWFYHLPGPEYDRVRQAVNAAMGLTNAAGEPFAHAPAESPLIAALYEQYKVFARHGDIFDPVNYAGQRDAASFGDALVVALLNRFPQQVKEKLGSDLPDFFLKGLKEIDNVRPLLRVPVWVEGLLQRAAMDRPSLAPEVLRIWNDLADHFLSLDFVRSSNIAKLGGGVDQLASALKLSAGAPDSSADQATALIQEKIWPADMSYHKQAVQEAAFQQGQAQFIVYGHTHQYEIVPLNASPAYLDQRLFNSMYLNSGTWRPIHELARPNVAAKEFGTFAVMTYLAFFKDDERGGQPFESWSGTLGVPQAAIVNSE